MNQQNPENSAQEKKSGLNDEQTKLLGKAMITSLAEGVGLNHERLQAFKAKPADQK